MVDRHYVHEGSFHAFNRLAERASRGQAGLTFGVAITSADARLTQHIAVP